jgi:predicted Zn-dependent peptidase
MLNRTIAPVIIDPVEFELSLPNHNKYTLKNGVPVYTIDMGEQDTLMVNWIFSAGNCWEQKNLVAASANHLLKNGTSRLNAFGINEHFEYYGAYLNRSCQNENAEIMLHTLGRHLNELLPVVSELITDSIFPADELVIFKKNMQQRLEVSLKKSDFVAGRLIDAFLFGEKHPYGRYSSFENYEQLEREEIQQFYRQYYQNGQCLILAAGKLPPDLIEQLDIHFGGLNLQKPGKIADNAPFLIDPAIEKKHAITIDPVSVQCSIRIARNFPSRKHPDFQKVQVLNCVLGGFFGSRLMTNIREDKGYTYGIHSYLMNLIQDSAIVISTEAGKEVTAATIEEVYKEMRSLREELIDEEELHIARDHMIGAILGDLDGPFQIAARWKNLLLNELDESYFYRGVDIIKSITAKELLELANLYLRPEDFYELIVA